MTRDEQSILVAMLGGHRPFEIDGRTASKTAMSRLIARGYVRAGRSTGHPRSRNNRYSLTIAGRLRAVRLARKFTGPRNHVRPPDHWNPRPSKIALRIDRYGYRVYGP